MRRLEIPQHPSRMIAMAGRRVSAPLRSLPQFLIIGAQKSGTTSLVDHLGQHPCTRSLRWVNEVHFFDANHERGSLWYRSQFPLRAVLVRESKRAEHPVLTGEKTPSYLFHPLAAARAAAVVPEAKPIALLRNPVDRAISQYRMNVARGVEPLSFPDAIAAEPERTDAAYEEIARGRTSVKGGPVADFSYVRRGLYGEQLDRWLAHFPRPSLLVVRSEDLASTPAEVYQRVLRFLDLPPHDATFSRRNESTAKVSVDAETRVELAERFHASNARVEELTGITWDEPTEPDRGRPEGR